jgi:hypothetical protein
MATMDIMEEADDGGSANPLEIALETSQALLLEKTQIREALEAEAQEVAQVCKSQVLAQKDLFLPDET